MQPRPPGTALYRVSWLSLDLLVTVILCLGLNLEAVIHRLAPGAAPGTGHHDHRAPGSRGGARTGGVR